MAYDGLFNLLINLNNMINYELYITLLKEKILKNKTYIKQFLLKIYLIYIIANKGKSNSLLNFLFK